MIILFVIDTSASMLQRAYNGLSLLDIAKCGVENFIKLRNRDPNNRDRFMLMSYAEGLDAIKVGFKEPINQFLEELKNLKASDMSCLGPTLQTAFDFLNQNRISIGIDNFGLGRIPWFIEPAMVVLLTDGGQLSSSSGLEEGLRFQKPYSGSELASDPYRWDQRLFTIVLKFPGSVPSRAPTLDERDPLKCISDETGGRVFCVNTMKALNQCIENLVVKLQLGVVVSFECMNRVAPMEEFQAHSSSPQKGIPNINCYHRMIYMRQQPQPQKNLQGTWPIPESYFIDGNASIPTPRKAHPVIYFSSVNVDSDIIKDFPFDKYELEACSLTHYMLSQRKKGPVCWQVFMKNSRKGNQESKNDCPFGFLKTGTATNTVSLYILPYNYPVLFKLLDELIKNYKMNPPPRWRQEFDNYLQTLPFYYVSQLKNVLRKMSLPNIVPDHLDGGMPFGMMNFIKKIKAQAKVDHENFNLALAQRKKAVDGGGASGQGGTHESESNVGGLSNEVVLDFERQGGGSYQSTLRGGSFFSKKEDNLVQKGKIKAAAIKSSKGSEDKSLNLSQKFRNAFDIGRGDLLSQLQRMKANFLSPVYRNFNLEDEDLKHNVPIGQMGDYQEAIKKRQPLRDAIDEDSGTRPLFGNPFRNEKRMMQIDEADEATQGQQKKKRSRSGSLTRSRRSRSRSPTPRPDNVGDRRTEDMKGASPPKPNRGSSQMGLGATGIGSNIPVAPSFGGERDVAQASASLPRAPSLPSTRQPSAFSSTGPSAGTPGGHHQPAIVTPTIASTPIAQATGTGMLPQQQIQARSPSPRFPVNQVPRPSRGKEKSVLFPEYQEIKNTIVKELKKPGKNYDGIFANLKRVKGDSGSKKAFVSEIIVEAKRYKKHLLIKQLQDFQMKIS
eukprot:Nk52_evm47s255 gene=Nk52_evmTU47s255